jgi:cytochrome c nitrite reductase small subunit
MPARFLTLPWLALAALTGITAGIGGTTFVVAEGASYATDDPAACANCHVMQPQLDGWRKGPHHAVATCNDCHTPSAPLAKLATKAENGWHHGKAFTTGDYPDTIVMRASSREVVEGQCRSCHSDMVAAMGGDVSCIRCHESAGHLR